MSRLRTRWGRALWGRRHWTQEPVPADPTRPSVRLKGVPRERALVGTARELALVGVGRERTLKAGEGR